MSAFKFACPVCGQHITCDAASSGSQMNCPTCFRKLLVPQAPASEAQNFVLTATEVSSRPTSATANGDPPPIPGNGKRNLWLTSLGVIFLVAAAVAVLLMAKQMLSRTAENDPGLPPRPKPATIRTEPLFIPPPPAPDATNWTLNLAEAKIPATPAQGVVHGFGFKLDRATIQGGKLDLRQGPKWPPDVGLSIHLYADRPEDLAGRSVVLESTRPNAPRVILRWKDEQNKAQQKEYRSGYAARVEFGPVTNNQLTGKIFLATPDESKSYAAGTFSAQIRPKK